MEKYTPGPWKRGHSAIIATKTDDDGDPIVISVPFGVNKKNNIRGLDCYSIPPQAEAQGNATLMLAAPEMYKALKAYEELDDKHANCEECDGVIQPEGCAECFPYADSARLQMMAAIAKAEGINGK